MLKTAVKNLISFMPHMITVLIVTGTGISLFALVYFFGIYAPLKNFSHNTANEFSSYLISSFTKSRIENVLKPDFLRSVITGAGGIIQHADESLKRVVIIDFALALLILFGARQFSEFLAKRAIRKRLMTENSVKGFFAGLLRSALSLIFWAAYLIVSYFWFFALFLLPFVALVLDGVKDLLSAWLVHFRKEKITRIINVKTILAFIGTRFLLQTLLYGFLAFIIIEFNIFGLIAALPVLSYFSAVLAVTSTKYFIDLEKRGGFVTRLPVPRL